MRSGERLGSYTVIEEIGKGGMAEVYRARQQSVDRDVAIKVILKGIVGDPAAVQRFQREAKLIARLEHPHILPVYDFDGTHEPPYIVMRYLDGGTLKDAMAQGLLPFNEIVHLIHQISSALDYAHRQGIIHRDIKPSNILVDRDGNAFVSDLGLARLTGTVSGARQITETGVIMGTPDYMSPEQAVGGEEIDHRTDIYALGVILFEMLTGALPFNAPSGVQMLMQHIQSPVPSVRERRPELPDAVDMVMYRVLAKDRSERYETASEFGADVAEALGMPSTGVTLRLREAVSNQGMRRDQGTITDSQATPSEQNKTVTVLCASAAAYGELVAESNGDEAARRATTALMAALERICDDFGGQTFSRLEYDLLVLWGADAAREDDAERAVRAAIAMQKALRELGAAFLEDDEPLPLNIGIHRGLALLTPHQTSGTASVSGATISLASRLMQNAEGVILITHDIFRLVLGIFDMLEDEPLKMRGRDEKLPIYRVYAAKARVFRGALRGVDGVETPMVGREAEFKQLQKAFLMAVEDKETQVVTIVSDAGVGKSRLLSEFDKWGELRPLEYYIFNVRATAAMTHYPYALIRDLVTFRFDLLDEDAPAAAVAKIEAGIAQMAGKDDEMAHLIAYLAGIDMADSPYLKEILRDGQETSRRARQAFIRFITSVARVEPVVMQLEDIHYADEASLDLLNEMFTSDENLHLVIIACARPNLYERRPTWGSGQHFHTRIDLKALDKRDSRDLASAILRKITDVPKQLRDLLVERSEGIPLYMEELVKMLLDDHIILPDGEDRWRVEVDRLGALSVPSTLTGLLEARFDTLLHPEKLTLQRASVIGRIFYDNALHRIDEMDDVHLRDLRSILSKLVERGFIYRRETSGVAESAEYIFASAMLRDTLYERLLERQLRTYHTGAAHWLASLERADDYLTLIADHYEKAGDNEQATAFLHRAGELAAQKGAYRDATELYRRALAYVPAESDSSERLPLLLALGEAINRLGSVSEARQVLVEALQLARAVDDPAALAHVLYQLSLTETNYGDYPAALVYLNEALPLARAGTNMQMLANVLYGLANTHYRAGHTAEGIAAADECITLCEQTGDAVLHMYALNRRGTLTSASEHVAAIARFEGARAIARRIGHRVGEQAVLINLGFRAMANKDTETAIRYTEQGLALAREVHNAQGLIVATLNLVDYYISAATPDRAFSMLYEGLTAARQQGSLAWVLAALSVAARTKLVQGRVTEGLQLLGLARYHPAVGADVLEDIARWLDDARNTLSLSETDIEAGLNAGKTLDVDTSVEALLQELAGQQGGNPVA